MKKAIIPFVFLLLCGIMTGCTSKAAKETQTYIEAIGEVSVTSGEAICEAERLYKELTDEDKENVTNYAILEEARNLYQVCIIDEIDILLQSESYEKTKELVSGLDSLTLENIKYDIVEKIAKPIVSRVLLIRDDDLYYDSVDVPHLSEKINSACDILSAIGIVENDEYYIVIDTLNECKAYLEDGIQYLDMLLLDDEYGTEFLSIYQSFSNAFDMQFYTLLQSAVNDCAILADKVEYSGTQEYGKKYADTIKTAADGMREVYSGFMNSNKQLALSGFEKLSAAAAFMKESFEWEKEHDLQMMKILEKADTMWELLPD